MSDAKITGSCLCGALRYEASAAPLYMGYCCCADCRKASGSGFIGFMGFAASALRITGDVVTHTLLQNYTRSRTRHFTSCVREEQPVCRPTIWPPPP
ncbi:MAG: GFA family protein [Rhizomicrobium sp.]